MKRKNKTTLFTITAVVILILLTAWFAYGTSFKFFQKFYPAVLVGTDFISIYDWQKNQEIAKTFDSTADDRVIDEQFIKNSEKAQLVRILKISFDRSSLNQEFKFETAQKSDEFQRLLKSYFFNDENLFVKYVTIPQLYNALLRIKYNSDARANASAYTRAKNILSRIENGEKFEDVANSESDDKLTGQLGGDLGFVSEGQILPELQSAIITSTLGQVRKDIVVSRDGLHIIYPMETAQKDGQKVWHVKHILIATAGFDNWLNAQLNQFFVWRIK